MAYYSKCTEALIKEYHSIEPSSKNATKILLINTCGWVEGIGAKIQMDIVQNTKPDIVVTMCKNG
jgi:polynucleotide 5'-kinase involved in rRNA processing